jgi:hypothetical protein
VLAARVSAVCARLAIDDVDGVDFDTVVIAALDQSIRLFKKKPDAFLALRFLLGKNSFKKTIV